MWAEFAAAVLPILGPEVKTEPETWPASSQPQVPNTLPLQASKHSPHPTPLHPRSLVQGVCEIIQLNVKNNAAVEI